MIYEAHIRGYDGHSLVVTPTTSIDRDLLQKQVNIVELRLVDGRMITAEQRRKVFAVIRDISNYSGHEPEELRALLTWEYCGLNDIDLFSLSTVDRTTAKGFIDYLIDFCFTWNVPTQDTLLKHCDDIDRYLYMCLEHRKCAICNGKAEVHHVDRIGMGRNRERIVHVGLNAIALCREHHMQAHTGERRLFEKYHIHGIKLDEYLCGLLNLKKE